MRNALLFIINPTNIGPWGEHLLFVFVPALYFDFILFMLQNEMMNAEASLVFVISGMLKSTAARLIL